MEHTEIVVIVGPMFAGKSDALVKRLEEAAAGNWSFAVFKPKFDTRTADEVRSRRGGAFPARVVDDAGEIGPMVGDEDIVGIDEAHMLKGDLVDAVLALSRRGKTVFVSGIDITWKGTPFPSVAGLLGIATEVVKLRATCHACGRMRAATRSQRMIDDPSDVVIGDADIYEARCLNCFAYPAAS